jgi:hypothetical protein
MALQHKYVDGLIQARSPPPEPHPGDQSSALREFVEDADSGQLRPSLAVWVVPYMA